MDKEEVYWAARVDEEEVYWAARGDEKEGYWGASVDEDEVYWAARVDEEEVFLISGEDIRRTATIPRMDETPANTRNMYGTLTTYRKIHINSASLRLHVLRK